MNPIIGDILSRSGVKMYQIFRRNNDSNSSVIPILHEMFFWALEHDPPANILLICEDVVDFAGTLNQLCLKRYNIMVAQTSLDLIEGRSPSIINYEEQHEKSSSDENTSSNGDTSDSDDDSDDGDISERELDSEGIKAEELYNKVEKERVPLVKSIFEKYGDIFARRKNYTLETDLEDWEYVCEIYETLKDFSMVDITLNELKRYRSTMHTFDYMDVKIEWFKKRIDAIITVKELIEAGLTLSDVKERVSVDIENNKKDTETNKKKLAKGMNALELVPRRRLPRIKQCWERIKDLEEKGALLVETMNVLFYQSLVDELL
ncbi:hypothetical protein ABFX02_11G124200 [Erythranthe guttata]